MHCKLSADLLGTEIYSPGHFGAKRVNCNDHYSPMAKVWISYSVIFLAFKHAATIMCKYRFFHKINVVRTFWCWKGQLQ